MKTKKMQRRKAEGGRGKGRAQRRGVLLLIVLSMLLLFMLIGTAFLMSASQSRDAAKNSAKHNQFGNYATKQLERALYQLLRDTDNPHSVMLDQSLLRDLYGTQGFQGRVYSPTAMDLTTALGQVTRFAGATAGTPAQQMGPTAGQFVDIYVRQLGWNATTGASLDDPQTTVSETNAPTNLVKPDLRHVVKLDRDVYGQTQLQALPLTKGYFNGCLLTITSGAAAGQTSRILDYEYIADVQPITGTPQSPPYVPSRLFRFRVLTFQRGDGQPLQIGSRAPEIADLAGASFIVNGRAYGGTGAGYNPLAVTGQAKSSALVFRPLPNGDAIGAELALLPNATYFNPLNPLTPIGAAPGVVDAFTTPIPAANVANIPKLNNLSLVVPVFNYPTWVGPGDANESYDAADYNNMFLALQTVTPRSQGRVVQSDGTFSADDPTLDPSKFLRLDLEDVPLPSFHRPDLINFWYHRLLRMLTNTNGPFAMQPDAAVLAILDPYPNGTLRTGLDPQAAALITAIKRQSSMRPLREDHPNFDGSNRLSVPSNLPTSGLVDQATMSNIAIPFWQAVGPWDVDNDNDGIPDSIWIDLGDPIQEAEDGTRYKALYAFLVIDLDSRLNVNAHGLADDISPSPLALSYDLNGNPQTGAFAKNLAGSTQMVAFNSNMLAQGVGYGPAEISLRPVFPAPWSAPNTPIIGNRDENAGPVDSYAAAKSGRLKVDGTGVSGIWGYKPAATPGQYDAATPGLNYAYTPYTLATILGQTAPDLIAQMKFCGYPWAITQRSCFGSPPDLFARYSLLGLDYMGAPVYEVLNDTDASNNTLPRPLLTDSPYEVNLSGAQRRDQSAGGSLLADSTQVFGQSLVQNDDAPFSPTDLEKVLRPWDSDSGTLPSRLWDCTNAFDPLKLLAPYGDPIRVGAISQASFGATGNAEVLTTAQQMAGVNRRLITTDSFSLPVSGGSVPNQTQLSLGADGAPGRFDFDDDGANGKDDAGELNAAVSDDFRSLFGKEVAQATVFDLLRYRVWKQVRTEVMLKNSYTEATLAGLNAANYSTFLTQVSLLAEARLNGEGSTDINGNGTVDPPLAQLLAPDVVAGLRMDVNRPFGDGLDSDGNLVVDDVFEAGEPYLDINSNGKRDNGEPFIDLDGNKSYLAPSDKLWQGLTAESIEFDYTNGQAERVYKGTIAGGVRNLEAEGRQLYARNLYCMMLLLMDENYIAPWDENDPQLITWMDTEKAKLTAAPLSLPADQADLIVKRKLTCRMVAQWAINCVEMRDVDVISTPFEYDENPWDGWGVPDAKSVNIPLDGDAATDENKGELIDWANIPATGGPKKFATVAQADLPTALNQTRGVVWGAERPELLITETLAFHDRRTEDLLSPDSNGHGEMKHYQDTGETKYKDPDPDQGMRPRGSAFVEIYNPSSPTGQFPAEVYARLDSTTTPKYRPTYIDPNDPTKEQYGVDMSRLSNFAWDDQNGCLTLLDSDAAVGIKRSPVWRMIVVEEWPDVRNADAEDDKRLDRKLAGSAKEPPAYTKVATKVKSWLPTAADPNPPYRPTDPDFDGAFDANFLPKQVGTANQFEVQYPYIEREFYFTTDNSPMAQATSTKLADWNFAADKFKLRIPNRAITINWPASWGTAEKAQTQKFIAYQLETAAKSAATPKPAIAPILPGRYGVVGSAGEQNDPALQVYRTTLGRPSLGGQDNTLDSQYHPEQTRRIEMRPSSDPNVQQLAVVNNGGDPKDELKPISDSTQPAQQDPTTLEIGRDNELINDKGTVKNIYGLLAPNGSLLPGQQNLYYQPCVSIPVEGMSITEPTWGYQAAEYEASQFEKTKGGNGSKLTFRKTAADKYQGRYYTTGSVGGNPASYDKAFDGYAENKIAPELIRTGTTPNYRTIHLQRLANPLLPWNPTPKLANGQANPDHKPNMPINPYRTVDTAGSDVTAFNGASDREGAYPDSPSKQDQLYQNRPWVGGKDRTSYLTRFSQGTQVWHFRSSERGGWARLNIVGSAATPATAVPQRTLWAQEPAMVKFKKAATELFDLIPNRQMTMRVEELLQQTKTDQNIVDNHMNMVMEHSLGFGNESFGLLYDAQGSQGIKTTPPSLSAIGAPAPGDFTWDKDGTNAVAEVKIPVGSTNPWFEWGNRPYVSSEELLNVPVGSQSTMLRFYSAGASANPYDGTGLDGTGNPVPNMTRLAAMRSPYGQLLNFTQTSVAPARLVTDATGNPVKDANGNLQFIGAPNFYRVLDYVQVPSRFVGTETMLNAETFNEAVGVAPSDPRYAFQPPYNKISRQRDPGRVNLNTVTGRNAGLLIWSDVFDGIMHRDHDRNLSATQLGHLGPAWRDIVLSRKGYAQVDAGVTMGPNGAGSNEKKAPNAPPDVQAFGLNPNFPSIFSNPFRSPDAGDLVPLQWMVHYGVDAGWMRRHHYNRGGRPTSTWGMNSVDDNNDFSTDDTREAGFGGDDLVVDSASGELLPVATSSSSFPAAQSGIPLLSESFNAPYYDGDRNPYNYYQPMTRLGNLVTNRSGVFGVWITVGYFEVEPAPKVDPQLNDWGNQAVKDRCGGDINLYNRIYPDGYMLGRELGVDTGDTKRARGFYIIDRTEEVGFKPGEDLNVEKLIRLRRRIE